VTGQRPPVVVEGSEGRPFRCSRCGSAIAICAFCEDIECESVICYRCLRQEVGQSLAQPHAHGG
jgi:hypothetical protein